MFLVSFLYLICMILLQLLKIISVFFFLSGSRIYLIGTNELYRFDLLLNLLMMSAFESTNFTQMLSFPLNLMLFQLSDLFLKILNNFSLLVMLHSVSLRICLCFVTEGDQLSLQLISEIFRIGKILSALVNVLTDIS